MDGVSTVTIHAHDGDANRADGDRATQTFEIRVFTPTAALSAIPAPLTEGNLHGARLLVTLTESTFLSGVALSDFTLTATGVPGLRLSALAPVAAGDIGATLTLAYDGTDFDAAGQLSVRVADSVHAWAGALTTPMVSVAPSSLDIRLSPSSLALNEAPGATNTHRGRYTVVLEAAPAAAATLTVASGDPSALSVDPPTLRFTASNWSAPQTVTATALQDEDAASETVTIRHAAGGEGVLATLAVTVTDDDLGRVLLDADPTTDALDPGPLALNELATAAANARTYSVRLSAAPTGSVTMTLASGDPDAVALSSTALRFDATNWSDSAAGGGDRRPGRGRPGRIRDPHPQRQRRRLRQRDGAAAGDGGGRRARRRRLRRRRGRPDRDFTIWRS